MLPLLPRIDRPLGRSREFFARQRRFVLTGDLEKFRSDLVRQLRALALPPDA